MLHLWRTAIWDSLQALLIFSFSISLFSGCSKADAVPPNIVLILSDDQGCGDLGFMDNGGINTPNLDQLATESVQFTEFYVTPVCAPTRAGLLTGRHHLRTGVRGVIEGREFMVEDEVTLAEVLQANGYRTALFGKWHLGENYPWLPHGQGFDEYIGFRQGSSDYFDVVLDSSGTPYPTTGYLTDVLTNLAIDFVDRSVDRNVDQPFFLYLPYNAPHGPLQVPEAYLTPYDAFSSRTASVYAMMTSLDENIGRLVSHLEEKAIDENTIVIYLSDNGPLFGNRQSPDARFNCNLRGQKYDVYEGGIKTPLLIKWPGKLPAGIQRNALSSHIDLMPTILDMAGISMPDSLEIDGMSLKPIVEYGEDVPADRTVFITYPGEQVKGKIDSPYPGGTIITNQYKMVDGEELYDMRTDGSELINLADSLPDVLRTLDQAYLSYWEESTAERQPYPRVQVGHPEENPSVINAHYADLSGGLAFQFGENPPRYRSLGVHHDWISKWDSKDARATWHLNFVRAAIYQVDLHIRCSSEQESIEVSVAIGGTMKTSTIMDCSSVSATWHPWDAGRFDIVAGDHDVVISVEKSERDTFELDGLVIERII